jgi:hypothetical protein
MIKNYLLGIILLSMLHICTPNRERVDSVAAENLESTAIVYERVFGEFESPIKFPVNEYACGVQIKLDDEKNLIKGLDFITCKLKNWLFQRKPKNSLASEKFIPTKSLYCDKTDYITSIELKNDISLGFTGLNIYCGWDQSTNLPSKRKGYSLYPTG